MIKNILFLVLIASVLQACVIPGMRASNMQVAQYPHKDLNLGKYRKGIVVFKGISCPLNSTENSDEESFIKNAISHVKSVACPAKAYEFAKMDEGGYTIRQLRDISGFSTRRSSDYEYYTVPAGRYYYKFQLSKNSDESAAKNAFYFDVKEGEATYVGDFVYDSTDRKIIVHDAYNAAKSQLQKKLPVELKLSLAKGSKVKYK